MLYQNQNSKVILASQKRNPNDRPDPTLICSAFKKNRFYLFSRREPSDPEFDKVGRDIFNEKSN